MGVQYQHHIAAVTCRKNFIFMNFKSFTFFFPLFLIVLLASRSVQAHHGQDFMTVEGYEIPAPLKAVIFSDFEWGRTDGNDEYGIEPGVLLGLFPRTALDLETRFGREPRGDWQYTSVTPSLLFQLTPPSSAIPFRVAVSLGYEFADKEDSGGHHHEEESEEGGHHEEAEHRDDDHAESPEHSHATGGHQHGVSGFEGRIMMEYCSGDWLLGGNFIVDTDAEKDLSYGYSAGVRYRVTNTFAAGLEAEGDFADHGSHELIAGVYFEPVEQTVIKLGAGFGLTEESPDFALHLGLVYRF